MLTIWGAPGRRSCSGITRRQFFSVGALGLAGLSLADVLRLRAQAGTSVSSPKSVIMACMIGGPSHIDTYDMKPDAPSDFRGELRPIATNIPGLDICEWMPQQTRIADKLSVIRTVISHAKSHNASELLTGYALDEFDRGIHRPAFGSVVSALKGSATRMPPFVAMRNGGGGMLHSDPVYLGAAHRPFVPGTRTVENLALHRDINFSRLEDRKTLLSAFDGMRRELDDSRGTMAGMDAYTQRALDMITHPQVREAFDIGKEPERVRNKFKSRYSGFQWLQAIRLAQAGVPVIAFDCSYNAPWDTHSAPTPAQAAAQADKNRSQARETFQHHDQMVHAMVTELYDRGLEKDVALVFWGEMGRTPRIKNGGRDHWDLGFAVLAGGGFRSGQAIGKTSPRAEFAVEQPYTVQNVLASLYTHLGIDPAQNLQDLTGRPIPLLDDTRTVAEL